MRPRTVEQVERKFEQALRALGVGYLWHTEYRCTEQGGKIILGRHVTVYVSRHRLSRVDQERVARVFRRLWHGGCQVYNTEQMTYGGGGSDVKSGLTLTF